ncbi:hypothetical protein HWV62_30099 [Athelia sp. TMB]|nr:hypothetical protein HWV62_30099 [Athelia sp. TMB]
MAVASAVLEHLLDVTKCKTLFITHYPLVATELEKKYPQALENLHMAYTEDVRVDGTREITFLYQLTKGLAKESFGVECARLAGLPESPGGDEIEKKLEDLRIMIDSMTLSSPQDTDA